MSGGLPAPVPDGAPESSAQSAPPDEAGRRTHPISPFLSGGGFLLGLLAIVGYQRIPELIESATLRNVLITLAAVGGVLLLSIIVSGIAWWRTRYVISDSGVEIRSGLLTLSRRSAPRSRIETVSIERPFRARLLGLAKVRVEIAGGADSHLDIAYVSSREAERIRAEVLVIVRHAPAPPDGAEQGIGGVSEPRPDAADGTIPGGATSLAARARAIAYDHVTDGRLVAQVPTTRLLRSIVRDLSLIIAVVLSVLWVLGSAAVMLWIGEFSWGWLWTIIPALLVGPSMIRSRLESGWGFVSRLTDHGLRMRSGLFSTRTTAIGPDRIQSLAIARPRLWRRFGWSTVTVEIAGVAGSLEDDGDSSSVLPVGDRAELSLTLGVLLPPLGTADDDATIEHLLTARARDLDGVRPVSRWHWWARRTEATIVLPGAVVHRTAWLSHRLIVVPRGRIQGLKVSQGPLARRLGTAALEIGVGDGSTTIGGLPVADVQALVDVLAVDAATARRYGDREAWARPIVTADTAAGVGG